MLHQLCSNYSALSFTFHKHVTFFNNEASLNKFTAAALIWREIGTKQKLRIDQSQACQYVAFRLANLEGFSSKCPWYHLQHLALDESCVRGPIKHLMNSMTIRVNLGSTNICKSENYNIFVLIRYNNTVLSNYFGRGETTVNGVASCLLGTLNNSDSAPFVAADIMPPIVRVNSAEMGE